jgi:hypothetical protein
MSAKVFLLFCSLPETTRYMLKDRTSVITAREYELRTVKDWKESDETYFITLFAGF